MNRLRAIFGGGIGAVILASIYIVDVVIDFSSVGS